MSYSNINKSTEHFNTKLYTGNGSTNAITGVGFQPDWTWIKNRSANDGPHLYDAVRGVTKRLRSDTTAAEATASYGLTTFGTDGFTVGTEGDVNTSSENFVAWNWKAGTGQGSSNTDGSINTTYTSVNTTAGFSITSWVGSGANATVGHGLGAAPEVILLKNRSEVYGWQTYWKVLGSNKYLALDSTDAEATSTQSWNNTAPTSTVFSVGASDSNNKSGNNIVAYCFKEKTGYSKFGKYTGNGTNGNGTFVYLGFKPAFFLIKRLTTESWVLTDSKRGSPQSWNYILPDTNDVEGSTVPYDFVSNGVKFRGTTQNENGSQYVYMAFGQPLVGSNNVPVTAR